MKKIAVIYGTDHYYNISGSDLHGCVNDAAAWKAKAEALGFNVVYMTNPTDTVFKAAANAAIANSNFGDVLLIAGSSHGSNMPDTSGDEADHRDELICFSNFSASGGYLTDDQFRIMLAALKPGVVCDIFLDNCYSGTGTRLMPQVHKIPILANRYIPFPGKARKTVGKAVITTMKENLFAACGEQQTSAEVSVGGVPRGLASYYWQKALTTYPTYTRDQLMNWCKTKIMAVVPGQVPQLECQAAKAAQIPFT
jgi:metacaspase-1